MSVALLTCSELLTVISPVNFCSAGIGRTGTIVVIDMIIDTIDTLGKHMILKEFILVILWVKICCLFMFLLHCLSFPYRSGLWYWHSKIHTNGARAALWYGADWSPVQIHLPVCIWVHTDHQSQRQCLHGEKKMDRDAICVCVCVSSVYKKNNSCNDVEKSNLRQLAFALLTAVLNIIADCFNASWMIRYHSGLFKTNVDPERQNNQPHDSVTALWVWITPYQKFLKDLSFNFSQETEPEYGNLQLKHQPASRKVSKWVSAHVYEMGCPLYIHITYLNVTMLPYFLYKIMTRPSLSSALS